MDIKELQARLIDQSKTWFPEVWDRSLEERISYNTIGICGEAGEVANKIKKWMRQDDEAINNLSQVPEEMADVLAYLLILAENLDCDLEQELLSKMEKNNKRFHS